MPWVLTIVVQRVLRWPSIVRLPRVITALEYEIRSSIVSDDEDNVTLQSFYFFCQLGDIDAAHPVAGDLVTMRRFPPAIHKPAISRLRRGLRKAIDSWKRRHLSASGTTIKADAKQIGPHACLSIG